MNNFVIMTSIFDPTEAVQEFDRKSDLSLIVVGDKKTPKNYFLENGTFLSVEKKEGFYIENTLPFNHYSRKMLGYLYAMRLGAQVIFETDDDNIPFDNWAFPSFTGKHYTVEENSGFVNVYKYFTDQKIWPRGFPLNKVNDDFPLIHLKEDLKVGVWQGLADEDPDVDAIYRLTDNSVCYFDKNKDPIVLKKGTICPFNTQNTAIIKNLFPLLYLPTTVTFRFTDILRGLIFQPLMWTYGYHLGFITSTVIQKRNNHDYMKDFASEIPCYLDAEKVVQIANESINESSDIYQNLYSVYENLVKYNVVKLTELENLSNWIKDCQMLLKD